MMFEKWRRRRRLAHREIFSFFDGTRVRRTDPLVASIRLRMHQTYKPEHLEKALSGDPISMQIVADAAVDVFGVKRWSEENETGLTEAERIGLVDAFDQFCYQLQKKTNTGQISPPSTEPEICSDSSESTTSDFSASGSRKHAPPYAERKSAAWASSPD